MESEKKRCDCGVAAGLVQGVYWLGIGVWLGALVMLAVSAAVTFHTAREVGPVLIQPEYNTAELAGQSGNILAGLIVGNVIGALSVIQLVCAVLVWGAVGAQVWTQRGAIGARPWLNRARVALLVVPLVALAVSAGVITPRMWGERQKMYDAEATVDSRKEARARFDGLHKLSERGVGTGAVCLIAAGLVSGVLFERRRGEA